MKNIEVFCQYCGTPTYRGPYCCEACERLDKGFNQLSSFKNEVDPEFKYLDQETNLNLYKNDLEKNRFKFYVQGVQCSSCVHLLEKIPEYYDGCTYSRLNMGTSELFVELAPEGRLSVVASLIKSLGYEASPIKSEEDTYNRLEAEQRADLKRIAITGACAGNIMLFSFSIYAGVQGDVLVLFRWLNLILFLPVFFYSAVPFYRGAWNALKLKTIHIDLPITVALVTSTLFSTYNLIRGSEDYYFDSTASFLFLIMVARFFVKKTQQKFLSPQNIKTLIRSETYALTDSRILLSENIQKGDVVIVSQDQVLPIDGFLVSDSALIDTSLMSGESAPASFTRGMRLFAGYKVLSSSVQVECEKEMHKSRVSELIGESYQNVMAKSEYLSIADRLAQKLLFVVFTVGILFFFAYGYFFNFKDAFDRTLALIVVACPCALAFGSPLTLAMAFKKAQLKGISIRNPSVFEKLPLIQNIFFDKTGTLTDGRLHISHTWPEVLPQHLKSLLVHLEKISYHPVAFAIRQEWMSDALERAPGFPPQIDKHEEVFGVGVRGCIGSDFYELKALPTNLHEDNTDMAIALYKNKEVQCRVYFKDHLRAESPAVVQSLLAEQKKVHLITGDKKRKALHVGEACGISTGDIYFELFPEDKKEIIARSSHALMIGDGLNDSLALSEADVGVAIKGSAELTLGTSDIIFLRGGLTPLAELFQISVSIQKTLQRNLTLSLIYNLIAGVLALLGFIDPLWAAVLMPASTFAVVLSTLWGFKSEPAKVSSRSETIKVLQTEMSNV